MSTMIEMRDHVSSLGTYVDRLFILKDNLQKAEAEAENLLQRYHKESRDVDKISTESFASSMLRFIHQYDAKLDKEMREEMEAKINYDKAAYHLESLRKEVAELEARIASYRQEAEQYTAELEKRKAAIQNSLDTAEGSRFDELERQRESIIAEKTEVEEAYSAANRVLNTARNVYDELDSAKGWATYDAFMGSGMITHMAKYSHIDQAQTLFNQLSSQLKTLDSELKDVGGITAPELTGISSTERAVDFWFDNIFTDLSVRRQVIDNADTVNQLINSVEKVVEFLCNKLSELNKELESNRSETEDLLVSLND